MVGFKWETRDRTNNSLIRRQNSPNVGRKRGKLGKGGGKPFPKILKALFKEGVGKFRGMGIQRRTEAWRWRRRQARIIRETQKRKKKRDLVTDVGLRKRGFLRKRSEKFRPAKRIGFGRSLLEKGEETVGLAAYGDAREVKGEESVFGTHTREFALAPREKQGKGRAELVDLTDSVHVTLRKKVAGNKNKKRKRLDVVPVLLIQNQPF